MSIVIPSYAPGAIASYSDLITEIRDLMDDANYDQATIDRAIRKAEAEFNRSLRAPEMEQRTLLTVTSELTALPPDFLQLRFIFQEGSPDSPLKSMSPAGMLATYAGVAGTPAAYSIEASQIRVGPVGDTTLELVYYRTIPQLSNAQTANWLLLAHPDIYVAATMYHLCHRERDSEGMAQWSQEVVALTQSINNATLGNRWGAGPLVPTGLRQVGGARC